MLTIFFVRSIAFEAFLVLRGSSGNVETPQRMRGGSRSPRGKRSHLRKVTAVANQIFIEP
ncbi:hypothetical protein FZC74_05390 [Sutcliffiella horikoshii]|uniref:Uncharacterized protein n=1 Tax=Sutcliffiella horikoshii TaxID=79883 RepID=A0AA94WPZ7_9BACI|nr:hypothetical protein FZC74_05390 [Sutcliffiella horikoshii]